MFVLSPDLVVLHALPGFWHPEDLVDELQLAKRVARLWEDGNKNRETKEKMFRRMHRRHVYTSTTDTYARSTWQHFDAHTERNRAQRERRDTVLRNSDGTMAVANGQLRLKPLNVLVHERMAKRPFQKFDEFDIESFVDYGKLHYDNNRFEKSRKQFAGQKTLMKKRRRAAKRAAKRS